MSRSPSSFGGNITGVSKTRPEFGITRNRKTHVIFNDSRTYVKEPAFVIERLASETCRSDSYRRKGSQVMLLQSAAGMIVKNYWDDLSMMEERTEASNSALSLVGNTGGVKVEEVSEWSPPDNSLQLNVLQSASPNLATSSPPRLRKRVPAGFDWENIGVGTPTMQFPVASNTHNADSPTQAQLAADSSIAMDRVFESSENDNERRDLLFSFWVPGGISDSTQLVYQLGFVGPATAKLDQPAAGLGQYCINFYGNGVADLFEKLANDKWILRTTFVYADGPQSPFSLFWVKIYKISYSDPRVSGESGRLIFASSGTNKEAIEAHGVEWGYNKSQELRNVRGMCASYVARCGETKPPSYETLLRVSERRDVRGAFRLATAKRPASATIVDDVISLPFFPQTVPSNANDPSALTVYWLGEYPAGCSVECKVYRADTGAELTYLGSTSSNSRSYAPVPNLREYFVKITLNTSIVDTPLHQSYHLGRGAITTTSLQTPTEYDVFTSSSIIGPTRNPRHESATIKLSNLKNDATLLRTQGFFPVKLEIEYQPDINTTDRCVLFKGFTSRISARRRVRRGDAHAVAPFYEYTATCSGMFSQLKAQVMPYNRPLWNPAEGLPYKITDVIKGFLEAAGFSASDYNIPDLPIRAYGLNGGGGEVLDILSNLGDAIFGLVDKYLGHYLVYNPNSGTSGQWVLLSPPIPPYQNKAKFVFGVDSAPVIPTGVVVSTARDTWSHFQTLDTDNLPITFIKGNTFRSEVKPPECNVVIACCFGKTTPNGVPTWQYQVFPNFKSYDFGNGLVDSTHPDYLHGMMVPLYVMVPELAPIVIESTTTPGTFENPALNWVGRRVFDVAAHAVKLVSFEAPLILVDEENPVSYNKRPLRYYDPVLVDGQQFLIKNVTPSHTKDFIQMAIYECEAPRI